MQAGYNNTWIFQFLVRAIHMNCSIKKKENFKFGIDCDLTQGFCLLYNAY